MKRAYVIGSGPNGLSAAIVLAQAGVDVEVFEAEAVPGGGARTLPLTLPGFMHDFGSAVHPMAAGSPFFCDASAWRARTGLDSRRSSAGASSRRRNCRDAGARSCAIRTGNSDPMRRRGESLVAPLVDHWDQFAEEHLARWCSIPRHPLFMARFGLAAFQPARRIASITSRIRAPGPCLPDLPRTRS